jgi:hypothetical protein
MEQPKFFLDGDIKNLTVREGKALEIKPPLVIDINGDIDTVWSFISKRKNTADTLQAIDLNKSVIIINKSALTIELLVNPEDFYGPKITGKMETSDELKPFSINEQKMFNREELVKLIRFSKRHFADAAMHEAVLVAFQKLSISGSTTLNSESDTRGNKGSQFTKKLDTSGIPTTFYLKMPIFKGGVPVKFMVEICLDSSDASVGFWFESVELKDLQVSVVEALFTKQKVLFCDFVIINK